MSDDKLPIDRESARQLVFDMEDPLGRLDTFISGITAVLYTMDDSPQRQTLFAILTEMSERHHTVNACLQGLFATIVRGESKGGAA